MGNEERDDEGGGVRGAANFVAGMVVGASAARLRMPAVAGHVPPSQTSPAAHADIIP